MSRIGRLPIEIPHGVTVTIHKQNVTVKGPKGELSRSFHADISITIEGNTIFVSRPTDNGNHRALHGLTRSLLANMVQGVNDGFRKNLELTGVGYRAQLSGNNLILQVGYSHPIEINPRPNLSLNVEGTNKIVVSGIDKEMVGEIAARIRSVRPPNPYTGKGIKYEGEKVRRKAGKSGRIGGK